MPTHFLSCDWGTTNFRLSLVDRASESVLASVTSSQGIQPTFEAWGRSGEPDRIAFYRRQIERAISELNAKQHFDLSGCPLLLSGMASSSIGMKELPYAGLPLPLDGSGLVVENIPAGRDLPHDLLLISGVQKPGDVMRGEEVQAMGWHQMQEAALSEYLLILPGTHSKHLRIKAGKIVGFQTYMTGELYQVLSTHSILKNSLNPAPKWDVRARNAFAKGVEAVQTGNLSNLLFAIRAKGLQGSLNEAQAGPYLSGLLIGHELSTLPELPLVLCSGEHLYSHYTMALEVLGRKDRCTFVPPERVTQLVWRGQLTILQRKSKDNTGRRFEL